LSKRVLLGAGLWMLFEKTRSFHFFLPAPILAVIHLMATKLSAIRN